MPLARIFASRWQRRECARGFPIFLYHLIGAPLRGTPDRFLYVSPRRFEEHLATLRAAGFASPSLADAISSTAGPRCVISFDDGCRNVFDHAPEILARHGFRAIQFLVAGLLGGHTEWDAASGHAAEPLADAAQIRDWLAAGHEIGSHTMTHPILTQVAPALAREELTASRKRLEDTFGCEVLHFAYPYGQGNEVVRDLVAEAGYATACTTRFGVNTPATPRDALRRIFPLSAAELLAKIADRLRRKLTSFS